MEYKKNDNDHSERVMNQLADSVLGLSDEAIVDEVGEAGADPNEEAERIRLVLRRKSHLSALEGLQAESIEAIFNTESVHCLECGWSDVYEAMTAHRKTSSLKR